MPTDPPVIRKFTRAVVEVYWMVAGKLNTVCPALPTIEVSCGFAPIRRMPDASVIGKISPRMASYTPGATRTSGCGDATWLKAYVIVFHGAAALPLPVVLLPLTAST